MPYKYKKNQKKYQKKYSKFRAKRNAAVLRAVKRGDFAEAKHILKRKPHIHIKQRRKRRGKK